MSENQQTMSLPRAELTEAIAEEAAVGAAADEAFAEELAEEIVDAAVEDEIRRSPSLRSSLKTPSSMRPSPR